MRFSNLTYLAIPVLAAASPPVGPRMAMEEFIVVAEAQQFKSQAMVAASISSISTPKSTPTSSPEENAKMLELRQAAGNVNLGAALTQATQAGTVTSNWLESTNDITTTWINVVYTQTFESIIDQMTTAGAGSIGLGTLTGTVGVVKETTSGSVSVMPKGTLVTVALGALGVLAGMGMIML